MDGIAKEVPTVILPFIRAMEFFNGQVTNLVRQGMGRIPIEEIIEIG